MHKPGVKELGELSHSALLLYEWTAYREHVARFYGRATRVVVLVDEDWDSDLGKTYAVGSVTVFDGDTEVRPNLSLIAVANESGIPIRDDEEAEEFVDDYVADLPIPFTLGNVATDDEVTIDLTQMPEGAKMAQRIWLED